MRHPIRPKTKSSAPSRRDIFHMAWPIMLANAAVPTLGLADTAIIGHIGRTTDLGAIALGSLIFGFVYWTFGFLRMGTTGFVAQAAGAEDETEVRAAFARALGAGLALGIALVVAHAPIATLAFSVLSGSPDVEAIAREYVTARIWGAPAALGTFAAMGLLVGLGQSRRLLALQLFLNGSNVALDVVLAGWLGWGVRGIALGTAIAEWVTLGVALVVCWRLLRARHRDAAPFWPLERLRDLGRLLRTMTANVDIMLRTLLLLFGFGLFTDQSARFGDAELAANHILLQFISFAAFLLDGYAFATEALVGAAIGARDRHGFDATVRRSSELAALTALALAVGLAILGPHLARLLTDLPPVQTLVDTYAPFAALYVVLSFAAFQLDGIFVGATRTRDMRNAAIVSLLALLAGAALLVPSHANAGLWVAFIGYVVVRALTLVARYPALRRSITEP